MNLARAEAPWYFVLHFGQMHFEIFEHKIVLWFDSQGAGNARNSRAQRARNQERAV